MSTQLITGGVDLDYFMFDRIFHCKVIIFPFQYSVRRESLSVAHTQGERN